MEPATIYTCLLQQRYERGHHYISVPVEGLPSDAVTRRIRVRVLPNFYSFKFYNCYSSRRYGGWAVTLVKEDRTVDMESLPAPDFEGFEDADGE